MSVCGVIPAAGRGSRLGLDLPKLLVPITDDLTIWDVLKSKMLAVCDHLVVVMSPWGEPFLQEALHADPDRSRISVAIQPEPIGMGDAVMQGRAAWSAFDDLCVIWGDQVHVSMDTLRRGIALQQSLTAPAFTLPVVKMDQPYVEYVFDADDRLTEVLQTREGAVCSPGGLGDVGTFLLTSRGLEQAWAEFAARTPRGALTGELNFLPFLPFLERSGWRCGKFLVADANEAKGINTQDDLAFFRRLYRVG